jgi:hypothetical protein
MSTTITREAWTWTPDVLAYADRYNLRPYLDRVLDATHQLFPNANSIEVFTEPDAEDKDLIFLVFEVYIAQKHVPDYLGADHAWQEAYRRIVPGPYHAAVCFSLRAEPE